MRLCPCLPPGPSSPGKGRPHVHHHTLAASWPPRPANSEFLHNPESDWGLGARGREGVCWVQENSPPLSSRFPLPEFVMERMPRPGCPGPVTASVPVQESSLGQRGPRFCPDRVCVLSPPLPPTSGFLSVVFPPRLESTQTPSPAANLSVRQSTSAVPSAVCAPLQPPTPEPFFTPPWFRPLPPSLSRPRPLWVRP